MHIQHFFMVSVCSILLFSKLYGSDIENNKKIVEHAIETSSNDVFLNTRIYKEEKPFNDASARSWTNAVDTVGDFTTPRILGAQELSDAFDMIKKASDTLITTIKATTRIVFGSTPFKEENITQQEDAFQKIIDQVTKVTGLLNQKYVIPQKDLTQKLLKVLANTLISNISAAQAQIREEIKTRAKEIEKAKTAKEEAENQKEKAEEQKELKMQETVEQEALLLKQKFMQANKALFGDLTRSERQQLIIEFNNVLDDIEMFVEKNCNSLLDILDGIKGIYKDLNTKIKGVYKELAAILTTSDMEDSPITESSFRTPAIKITNLLEKINDVGILKKPQQETVRTLLTFLIKTLQSNITNASDQILESIDQRKNELKAKELAEKTKLLEEEKKKKEEAARAAQLKKTVDITPKEPAVQVTTPKPTPQTSLTTSRPGRFSN